MRILMMLLILANLGFFAWTQWYAPASAGQPVGRTGESLGAGLQLAGEAGDTEAVPSEAPGGEPEEEPVELAGDAAQGEDLPEAGEQAQESATRDEGAAEATPEFRCVSLGPFDQLDIAELAAERLATRGYDARLREAGGQIRSGFWVYLPPQDSRGDAKDIEARLREKGVSDLFIVTGSENRNAISLGLFSTPDRADQRAAEIGRLGFNPQIAERFRDATVYWLDYREQGDDRLEPESIGVLGADELIPEKRPRDCAAEDFPADGTA